MKKLLIPIVFIFAACNSETNKQSDVIVEKEIPKKELSGCYEMIISKDSAFMNLKVDGNIVTGDLEYKRFEKDSNKGTFTGTYKNGIIDIWFNFQSEGVISVRQEMFKVMGESIIEGYGDVKQTGDTVIFAYPQTLKYEENHPFLKVECK